MYAINACAMTVPAKPFRNGSAVYGVTLMIYLIMCTVAAICNADSLIHGSAQGLIVGGCLTVSSSMYMVNESDQEVVFFELVIIYVSFFRAET
eukprot:3904378-Pleurochrysis_carterae.AAC.5